MIARDYSGEVPNEVVAVTGMSCLGCLMIVLLAWIGLIAFLSQFVRMVFG